VVLVWGAPAQPASSRLQNTAQYDRFPIELSSRRRRESLLKVEPQVMRKRGFSLLEVLAASLLLTITLAISLPYARAPQAKQGSKAEALVVADALRAARARAMASGTPTGIAIPSGNGATASSQAFYRLQGQIFPRITAVTKLSGDFPGAYLSAAYWSGSSNLSLSQPDTGSQFLVTGWQPPYPKDYTLIFLPSGKVLSNGLVHDAGIYHLIVSSGVQLEGGSGVAGDPEVSDAPVPFLLSAVSDPYTISISQAGDISVEQGISGRPQLSVAALPAPQLAGVPTQTGPAKQLPELLKLAVLPEAADLPTGIQALVAPDGHLRLEVTAWSPEGSNLVSFWEGQGQFSANAAVPLTWEPLTGVWRARVDWTPPAGLAPGNDLRLRVKVKDQFGNFNAGASLDKIEVRTASPRSKILFVDSAGSLTKIYDDGSSLESLSKAADGTFSASRWCPDGTKMAALNSSKVGIVVPGAGVVRRLGSGYSIPRWSPDGTRILYRGADARLHVISADGSGDFDLTQNIAPLVPHGGYSWSPDGRRVAYCTLNANNIWTGRTWVVNVDGSNRKLIVNSNSLFPSWSPDGSKIAFLGYAWPNGICIVDPDGNNLNILSDWSGMGWLSYVYQCGQYGWSPDSKKLSFYAYWPSSGWMMRMIDVTTKVVTEIPNSASNGENMGVWSPTGSDELLFNSSSFQNLELIKADGSGRRKLFKNPSSVSTFDWVK